MVATSPRLVSIAPWVALALVSAGGCDCRDAGIATGLGNHEPVAVAGPDRQVMVGASVQLDGSASSDIDGDSLSYAWRQAAGSTVTLSSPTAAMTTFTAPASPETLTFELTVRDTELASVDTVTLYVVTEITNEPPVANAGADRSVAAGLLVVLDGSGSADPDHDPITFTWTQVNGPTVTLAGTDSAQPYFTAPSVEDPTPLVFALTVSDGELASAPDSVTITIEPGGGPANQAPVAAAGDDQTVDMLTTVTLDGSASTDPEGASLGYHWAEVGTAFVSIWDPSVASPTFTAPEVLVDTDLTFALIVNDGDQDSMPDTVTVHVRHVNRAPAVAEVEPAEPHAVDEGQSLVVVVTVDDADGDVPTFTDNCSDYAYVTCLYDGEVATVTVAPGFDIGPAIASVTLHADDGHGGTLDIPLSVVVNDINRPPVATVTPPAPYSLVEGGTLTLNVGVTDPDDDALTLSLAACAPVSWVSCSDAGGGNVTIVASPPLAVAAGTHALSVGASDGKGGSLTVPISILVADAAAPVVGFTGLNDALGHIVNAGATDTAVAVAVAETGDSDAPYTCALTTHPIWVAYDDDTQGFTITPTEGDGDATVTLECLDSDGGVGSASFVAEVNHAPTAAFSWSPNAPVAGGSAALTDASTDPDAGDTHTCAWSSSTGATFTGDVASCTGVAVVFTSCAITHTVRLTVTDAHGLSHHVEHDITSEPRGPYVYRSAGCDSDIACGSQTRPWCSIQSALAYAGASSYTEIFVAPAAGDVYTDAGLEIAMKSGVSLHGGYNAGNWSQPPDRVANPTVIATTQPAGIRFGSSTGPAVTDVTFDGFVVVSAQPDTGATTSKANLTLFGADGAVIVQDNDIRAADTVGAPPSNTVGIDLIGATAAIIRSNRIRGGNGSVTASAIRYSAASPGDAFAGTIRGHRGTSGNGISGGTGADCAGLRFLGPVDAAAVLADNDISGSDSPGTITRSVGIELASSIGFSAWDNSLIDGGSGTTSIGVDIKSLGATATLISGATNIIGGSGTTAIGLQAVSAGDLTIEDSVIVGGMAPPVGSAPTDAIAVRLLDAAGGGLAVTLLDVIADGGTATKSAVGVLTAPVKDLTVKGGSIRGGHVNGTIEGKAFSLEGPGSAAIDGVTAIGLQRVEPGTWVGTGFGIDAKGQERLTLTGSTVMGGEADEAVGVSFLFDGGKAKLVLGGTADADANVISGAVLMDTGMPASGGHRLTGIKLGTSSPSVTPEEMSLIGRNTVMGGAAVGTAGAVQYGRGIAATGAITKLQIVHNALIQGCIPSCSGVGPTGATPPAFGVGIYIVGGNLLLDDIETKGGIADNAVIKGGAIASGTTNSPLTVGLSLEAEAGSVAVPRLLAIGNSIIGNDATFSSGPAYATGVRLAGGTLVLGTNEHGNALIEGGLASVETTGVAVVHGNAANTIALVDNAMIAGRAPGSGLLPSRTYGVHINDTTTPTSATIAWNTEITGGFADVAATGVVLVNVSGTSLVEGNTIKGGANIPYKGDSIGLQLVSAASDGLTIAKNLIEACGLYDDTTGRHRATCENADRSIGASLAGNASFSFWNNRVFGGYAHVDASSWAVGLQLVDTSASSPNIKHVIAHNFICAQGKVHAAAIRTSGPNGASGTGAGMYVLNNIFDTGAAATDRYHVFENAYQDMTSIVFLNNFFADDASATAYYREAKGSSSPVLYSATQIIKSCSDPTRCLDHDTTGATEQLIGGKSNYEGDAVGDPKLAGDLTAIRERPGKLPIADFQVGNDALRNQGYSFDAGNPYGLSGPRDDFEDQLRSLPPDIGHDEMPEVGG